MKKRNKLLWTLIFYSNYSTVHYCSESTIHWTFQQMILWIQANYYKLLVSQLQNFPIYFKFTMSQKYLLLEWRHYYNKWFIDRFTSSILFQRYCLTINWLIYVSIVTDDYFMAIQVVKVKLFHLLRKKLYYFDAY